jgi:hypothetical protein
LLNASCASATSAKSKISAVPNLRQNPDTYWKSKTGEASASLDDKMGGIAAAHKTIVWFRNRGLIPV